MVVVGIGCCWHWLLLALVFVVDISCWLYWVVGLLVVVLLVVGLYRIGGLLGFCCCCCCWLLLLLVLATAVEIVVVSIAVAGCLFVVILAVVFAVGMLLWLLSPSSCGRHQRGTGQDRYDSARTRRSVRNTEESI